MPNVLSPRDLVPRPDNMDETVLSSSYNKHLFLQKENFKEAVTIHDTSRTAVQEEICI